MLLGMRPRLRRLSLVLCVVPACQAPQADTFSFTTMPPATSGPGGSTGSSTGSTTETAGHSSEASSTTGGLSTTSTGSEGEATTVVLDVGSDVDLGGSPVGCKGKIDFLFVISRSGGMAWFQAQLLDAFPKFIDTIEAKFSDFDYHIMVVDGDPEWGVASCDEKCPVQCVPDYPCDYTPTACDTTMGAGVLVPAGDDASNAQCKIDGDLRYMVTGQTDLAQTFACVAQVGSSGGPRVAEALTAAMQSNINDPGGCNRGFLRKDALLMVTLISNSYEEDDPLASKGTPETWTEAVREAKGGDLSSVVMFSILRAYPECDPKDRTCQMVKMFPYWLLADRDEDYGPPFDKATDLVEAACAGFSPPG